MTIAERFDVFLIDLDGVVYLGGEPLPGAVESLHRLGRMGKKIRYLTNDPRPRRETIARHLGDLGIRVGTEEIVTSGWATARYLSRRDIATVSAVGSDGLRDELRAQGLRLTEGDPDAVVVGADERTTYRDIRRAVRHIDRGATFVGTNPDGSFPTADGPAPGAGAIVRAVETATGVEPIIVGKPEPRMFEMALEGVPEGERAVVIGDRPDTDVLGAHRAGLTGILVADEEPEPSSTVDFRRPDGRISGLADVFDASVGEWRSPEQPWSERIPSPGDTHPFLIVDAFTRRPLEGNPCAVVLDAEGLDDTEMQALARETNLSETAFVWRDSSDRNAFRARYFTPEKEIPFAGHPTVATVRALVDTDRVEVDRGGAEVHLALPAGGVDVDVSADGEELRFTMTQRPPEWGRIYDPAPVADALGLDPRDVLDEPPVQTVSTGTPMLMVRVVDLEALRRARMDIDAYRRLRGQGDFFSPHLYCLPGISEEAATYARHFGVPPDTLEDPFTGSATGAMAAHLWRHGLLDGPCFVAEQGHGMGRPGRACVEVQGPPSDVRRVRVGGGAVTVVQGTLGL